jgi:hypothetical protein
VKLKRGEPSEAILRGRTKCEQDGFTDQPT